MEFRIDKNAKYTKTHEWVRVEGDLAVIGVSDYAQHQLSDVVYVELPEVGDEVSKGEGFGTSESVKAAEELYSPVSGAVVEINEEITDNPALINEDPFGQGWMIKIKPSNGPELAELMDAQTYAAYLAELS